jgi:hypothetical protein
MLYIVAWQKEALEETQDIVCIGPEFIITHSNT